MSEERAPELQPVDFGTAELVPNSSDPKDADAWFVAYPVENPRYAVAVIGSEVMSEFMCGYPHSKQGRGFPP